jgi:serine/threonine-protein kinase
MPLPAGETFAGYTVLRLIGSGGMGEVYLVQHPRLPRRDALKVLRPDISGDASFRERFIREADIAATLWHPNIVGVHDRGEYEGQLWIAMDYVDGVDAAQLIQRRYPAGMPADEVSEIVTAVASALDYAHERGLLHRDVKPANIMLTQLEKDSPERRILLTDFGIARPVDDAHGLTTTNMTMGTVAYAAPEQLMGQNMDGRADQYALSATAYHLLTGTQLFSHSNPVVVISHHLNTTPPALASMRPDLEFLDQSLAKALAKNPDDRFHSCTDFARALGHQTLGSNPASPASLTQRAPVPSSPPPVEATTNDSRRRGLVVAGTVAVILLAVATLMTWKPWNGKLANTATEQTLVSETSAAVPPASSAPVTPATPRETKPARAAEPAQPCVSGIENSQVRSVVSRFSAQDIFPDAPDDLTVVAYDGNFDSCASLSAVYITIARGTGSTPVQVLLFHKGSYVGPATPRPHSFTSIDPSLTTDDTIVLKYGIPGSCMACADMTFTIVRFHWTGDHVEMIGTPPTTWTG